MRKVHYNPTYTGRKLGNIIVSYSPKSSCPDTCTLKTGGCYAWDLYYMRIMGEKIETGKQKIKGVEKPFNIRSLSEALKSRKFDCKIVRHRVAGDIIGDVEETIEDCKTIEKEGLINVGYTHAWREDSVQPLKEFLERLVRTWKKLNRQEKWVGLLQQSLMKVSEKASRLLKMKLS